MPLLMFYENAGGLDYLKRCGVAAPEQAPVHGRYQSPSEVRMAGGRLQGCRAGFTVGPTTFDVLSDRDDGAWTFLCFLKYRDADDEARGLLLSNRRSAFNARTPPPPGGGVRIVCASCKQRGARHRTSSADA